MCECGYCQYLAARPGKLPSDPIDDQELASYLWKDYRRGHADESFVVSRETTKSDDVPRPPRNERVRAPATGTGLLLGILAVACVLSGAYLALSMPAAPIAARCVP